MSMENAHWVFGYGSLIWRPGFEFETAVSARLDGLHRSLCIYSHHYRGTPEQPGLVFGLRQGGLCHGMAFRVRESAWDEVVTYLRARELVTGVYQEVTRAVRLSTGEEVEALTYVADESHEQFALFDAVEQQTQMVQKAFGSAGSNLDYVLNTINHLDAMGIEDEHLAALAAVLNKSDASSQSA